MKIFVKKYSNIFNYFPCKKINKKLMNERLNISMALKSQEYFHK